MPCYAWDIKVEDGTTEAEPKKQRLNLNLGVITKIEVKFPRGCHGLVKVRLLRFKFQLLPLSGGEWITGDNEVVPFSEYYELKERPAFLNFVGISPDAGYDHTITVRITVLPQKVASMIPVIDLLTRLLGRMGLIT